MQYFCLRACGITTKSYSSLHEIIMPKHTQLPKCYLTPKVKTVRLTHTLAQNWFGIRLRWGMRRLMFKNIDIKIVADGSYIGLEEAKSSWVTASHPAPGQFPHPMAKMTSEQHAAAQSDFEHELEKLNSKQGIWNDMTVFYVFGEK
jgi:hypothetical protein